MKNFISIFALSIGLSAFAADVTPPTERVLNAQDFTQLLMTLNQAPCDGQLAVALKNADAITSLVVTDVSDKFEGTHLKGQRVNVKKFSLRSTNGGWTGGAPSQPVAHLEASVTITTPVFGAPRYDAKCVVKRF